MTIKAKSSGERQPAQVPAVADSGGEIVCRERLGGLLKHYERVAA